MTRVKSVVRARRYREASAPPLLGPPPAGARDTGIDLDLASGLALERELQQQLFTSRDAAEGLAAYTEKRKPSFEGR